MTGLSITSSANPKFKLLKGILHEPSFRKSSGYFAVEGRSFVMQTLNDRPDSVIAVVVAEGVSAPVGFPTWVLPLTLFKQVTRLANADPILAIVQRPVSPTLQSVMPFRCGVVLDQIQSPSNMGAIIRNAVAFGADFVLASLGSCDPFHPESVRAMAGNWYQIPIGTVDIEMALATWRDVQWILLDSHADRRFNSVDCGVPSVVVIGSEGHGVVSPSLRGLGRQSRYVIPMRSGIESLNAAVSSGIMLHYFMDGSRKE